MESSSARTNRDIVVEEMKRALDVIQKTVVADSSVPPPSTERHRRDNSPPAPPLALTVNATDSGIGLSQLQTTAFRAIKDFEVFNLLHTCIDCLSVTA